MIPISDLRKHWPRPQRQRALINQSGCKGVFVTSQGETGPVLIQAAKDPRQKIWEARGTDYKPDTLHALAWALAPNASGLLKAVRDYLAPLHLGDSWFDIRAVDAIDILRQHAVMLRIITASHQSFVDAIIRQDEINEVKSLQHITDLFASSRFTGIWDDLFLDYAETEAVEAAL